VKVLRRADLADLCNERGIVRAVEIGTDRGIFAEQFLQRWHGEIMACIDPWSAYHHMPWDRTPDMLMAVALLSPFRYRAKLIRGESVALAPHVGTYYRPGFVYIDGDHLYASVHADIEAWWPHLPQGGILAGHDYMPGEHDDVVRAVDEFASKHGLEVGLTEDDAEYRSWWMVKA
jgi:hypothetical protein